MDFHVDQYQLISWRFQGHIITEKPCWTTVWTTLHGNTCMYREDYAAPWCIVNHTLVPLEVWSCIYSLSDNDYHYFSQLEATSEATWLVKMIRNDWFGRKHEVVSSRTVDPWFERGLPAVYQLPKVLKILKSDQSTKITLSIYLSSSLSWVSPLVTINSFGKPFWKYSKSPKISKFSDQKILRPFKNPQKTPKTVKSDSKSVNRVVPNRSFSLKNRYFWKFSINI